MKTFADKTQENQSKTASHGFSEKRSHSAPLFQFVDNRPEAVAQGAVQEMANNSPQAKRLMAYQEMANNSSPSRNEPQKQKKVARDAAAILQRTENLKEEPLPERLESVQKKENKTGMPDRLRAGLEQLSGMDVSDVRVHYNSTKPARLQALAYTQGRDIHVGPGQGKHLPHEAWHAVQQKQGRVQPTMKAQGVSINDDAGLEREADVMGAKALQMRRPEYVATWAATRQASEGPGTAIGASGKKTRSNFVSTPVQFRIAVTTDDKDTKADYVTLNSIAFGKTIAGGTIENFKDADFSNLSVNEKIVMVGHGSQTKSGDYTARVIGERLTVGDKKMPDGNHDITFTSCSAGIRTGEGNLDSVVDIVKAAITTKWTDSDPTVKGAKGPSIKTITSNGSEAWAVIKSDPNSKRMCGTIEGILNERYGVKIKETPIFESSELSLDEKATRIQEAQRSYFMDFVNLINGNWDNVSEGTQTKVTSELTSEQLVLLKAGDYGTGTLTV